MKIRNNESGLAQVVVIALVVFALGVVGFAGWKVWDRNEQKDINTQENAQKAAEDTTAQNTSQEPNADPDSGHLIIKEWGVKIKFKDADKVTYTYNATQKGQQGEGDSIIDSTIGLEVKPQYYKNKECNPAVGYIRYSKLTDSFFVERATKIGDYYYMRSGSPFNCENDSDNALNGRIREDFINIEAQ